MFKLRLKTPMFEGEGKGGATAPVEPNPQINNQQQTAPEFDYEKLASIITGKQSVTEDTVLKNYFKQQGLSKEEIETAISSFKEQKKASQPNVDEIQSQLQSANKALLDAEISNKALLIASDLGVSINTIPYIVKLADTSTAVVDGKIDDEKLKEALGKVLTDLPQLKDKKDGNVGGFKVGVGTEPNPASNIQDDLAKIFGNKE